MTRWLSFVGVLSSTACSLVYSVDPFEDGTGVSTSSTGGSGTVTSGGTGGQGGQGGATGCLDGTPAPIAIGQGAPDHVTLYQGRAYWFDAGSSRVRLVDAATDAPVVGDAAESLAHPTDAVVTHMAADRDGLFFAYTFTQGLQVWGNGALYLYQGNDTTLTALTANGGLPIFGGKLPSIRRLWRGLKGGSSAFLGTMESIVAIAATDATVYFAVDSGIEGPRLRSVPRSFVEMTVPQALAPTNGQVLALQIIDSQLYFTTAAGDVSRCPLAGCTSVTDVEVLATEQLGAKDIARVGGALYWIASGDVGAVMCMPLDGGTPRAIAGAQSDPTSIDADESGIYWTNRGSGEVMALRSTGE